MSAVQRAVQGLRSLDTRIRHRSDQRRVLVDARTPVNYTMVAPVVEALRADERVEFYFTASEEPDRIPAIYRDAPQARTIRPSRAAFMKFDAYLASDFMWSPLPRGTCRIQMFHGVGGKYGFDAPTESMREWHRLFFVNERRLRNFIASGAIDADSPAIRRIGMPKSDRLVDGSIDSAAVRQELGLDPSRPTVLYAPTWSPASSLNAVGEELIRGLQTLGVNVIVKLHDRSRDPRERYSGGIDWAARLEPQLARGRAALAPGHDISPYLVAADLLITDHSSAGFEFLLLDRPIVRIHRPALLALANVHADYVELLTSVSDSVDTAGEALDAVSRGLADPLSASEARHRVAADLFYGPGGATARAVAALYEAVELAPIQSATTAGERQCQPSA